MHLPHPRPLPDVDAIIDACWNVHDDATIVTHTTLAATLFARSRNDSTFTTTALTHRHIDKLTKDRLLHAPISPEP